MPFVLPGHFTSRQMKFTVKEFAIFVNATGYETVAEHEGSALLDRTVVNLRMPQASLAQARAARADAGASGHLRYGRGRSSVLRVGQQNDRADLSLADRSGMGIRLPVRR